MTQENPIEKKDITNFPETPDWFNTFRSPLTLESFNISYPGIGYSVIFGGNTGVQCEVMETDRGVNAELHFKPDADINIPSDIQVAKRNTLLFAAGFCTLAEYMAQNFSHVIHIKGFAKPGMYSVIQRYISPYPQVFEEIASERPLYPHGYKIDVDEFARQSQEGFRDTLIRKASQKVANWTDVTLINPRLQLNAEKNGYFTYFDPD